MSITVATIANNKISVLLLCYDMRNEVKNTLLSLEAKYQNFDQDLYEVLVLENPSGNELNKDDIDLLPDNFHYFLNKENQPLTKAMNFLATKATGGYFLLLVDGARILSKGILRSCNQARQISKKSIVAFHGFHLGQFAQQFSVKQGLYSKEAEEGFLNDINFPNNPDALFNNACFAGSSKSGYLFQMAESNCLFLPKVLWDCVGGFDERLNALSGGLANLDLYSRVLEQKEYPLFFVLGEGTFHQLHGGDTTSSTGNKFEEYKQEFTEKTGKKWCFPERRDYQLLGRIPPSSLKLLKHSIFECIDINTINRPPKIQANVRMAQNQNIDNAILNNKHFIFILAMHRSKSSYFARKIIQALPSQVPGTNLGGTSRSNPSGHYEPWEIVINHNNILRELNQSWRAISAINFEAMDACKKERFESQLYKTLIWGVQEHVDESCTTYLIKDPRISRMWPLWESLLKIHHLSYKKIILIDNPLKIAKSLYRRDRLNMGLGKLLWARYTYDSLCYAHPDDLIIDVNELSIDEIKKFIDVYLDCKLDVSDYQIPTKEYGTTEIDQIYINFTNHKDSNFLREELGVHLRFIEQNAEFFVDVDRAFKEIF